MFIPIKETLQFVRDFNIHMKPYGFTLGDLNSGANQEKKEHNVDLIQAHKIALDHLKENKNYYKIMKSVGL